MEAIILVIHLIAALSIVILVLVQPSEAGGFLGNSGTMSNMMAPKRGGDVLTRATTVIAGCFFATSLLLAIFAGHRTEQKSILEADAAPKTAVEKTAPAKPETPKAPISK